MLLDTFDPSGFTKGLEDEDEDENEDEDEDGSAVAGTTDPSIGIVDEGGELFPLRPLCTTGLLLLFDDIAVVDEGEVREGNRRCIPTIDVGPLPSPSVRLG